MPAINKRESPGKANPISNPVSANKTAKIPSKPSSETIELASNKFMSESLSVGKENSDLQQASIINVICGFYRVPILIRKS